MVPVEAAKTLESLLQTLLSAARLSLSYTLAHTAPTAENPALLTVEFRGPDTPLLLGRNAELLLALEHIAAKALHLEPDEHDLISFDAEGYKAERDRRLERAAREGVQQVRGSGQAYRFPPMTSRERRLLHLALMASGLPTRSEGDGSLRHIVLHPK